MPLRRLAALLVGGLVLASPGGQFAQEPNPPGPGPGGGPGETIVLSPVSVRTRPIGCFGLSVRARKDGLSPRVADMTILSVAPNSDADKLGLGPLTEILSIDGKGVGSFTASFDHGSDLSAKLINRKKGDEIVLEVLVLGARKPRRVTLVEGRGIHEYPYQSDSDVEQLRTVHVGISR
jgi:C-terminal processing protease CtpA/Prc